MCAGGRCESGAGRTIQLKGESVAGQRKYSCSDSNIYYSIVELCH